MSYPEIIRFPSREVHIGGITLGGHHPIRLQSMTNTRSDDVAGSVAQCIRIIEAGAHYVRLSVPNREAVASFIRVGKDLRAAGFDNPLIADIHYQPELAVMVAPHAAKVRINPGNYTDRQKEGVLTDTGARYQQELENIRQRIAPLVQTCLTHGTAIRIGTNMGSLSQRIIHRYGHTAEAMVQSTLEFLEILQDLGFYQTVISLKASNPQLMIAAYRQMVNNMLDKGMAYPLHLGVTEAGAGENGRIKSALGVATLLKQGIGDTIRVSLTEAPEQEIPFAQKLILPFEQAFGRRDTESPFVVKPSDPLPAEHPPLPGGHKAVVVAGSGQLLQWRHINISYHENREIPLEESSQADIISIDHPEELHAIPGQQGPFILPSGRWGFDLPGKIYPLFKHPEKETGPWHPEFNFFRINSLPTDDFLKSLKDVPGAVLLPGINSGFPQEKIIELFKKLQQLDVKVAILPEKHYDTEDEETLIVQLCADFSLLLMQRQIHGLWIEAPRLQGNNEPAAIVFGLLQASGVRITQTEFISCPTCARTSFDLLNVLQQVQQHCSHLPGLKIAIMGCVVNGPGEMADADFGILGTATGKIHIYKGQKPLIRNIEPAQAAHTLLELLNLEGFMNKG